MVFPPAADYRSGFGKYKRESAPRPGILIDRGFECNGLITSTVQKSMKTPQALGYVVAAVVSVWASFSFLRGSITGAPPLYSHTWSQRILHFIAGILFGALAIAAAMKLAGRW
jgi:hypothetical protein